MGSAAAYFLRELGFDGSVLVIERDGTYAQSSTALSASGIRQQFSSPLNVKISQFGAEFIKAAPERWGVDLNLRENGYLYLANTPEGSAVLRENHAVQVAEGADMALMDPATLAEKFPHLRLDDILLGSHGQANEGWFDGVGLMQGLRTGEYISDEIVGIKTAGGKVSSVKLASGRAVECGVFVNAAGPRAALVAGMAGIDIPVEARKRTNFLFDCMEPPEGDLPLMIDPSGVWCRPEGKHFLTGCSPANDPAVAFDDFEPRHAEFEEIIWPALAARSQNFEAIKQIRFWSGHYAYNTLDQNAVVGPHPDIPNFLFANGFSGHGLQQAPAVGRALAEWICHGEYQTLDFSPLGYERIITNTPLLERCVI
jgi:glycine/D-amino acid oxidase-like deaminating enzyme